MGQSESTNGYARSSSDSLFVIPSGYSLSSYQLQVLADEGQRIGLPFHIDDTHAVRPSGKRIITRFSECQISIRESTIRLIKNENSDISINFHYDSMITGEALIFVGAKDFSSKQELKISKDSKLLGPFPINIGKNLICDTSASSLFVQAKDFPTYHHLHTPLKPNQYDIILTVYPIYDNESDTCIITSIQPAISPPSSNPVSPFSSYQNSPRYTTTTMSPSNKVNKSNKNPMYIKLHKQLNAANKKDIYTFQIANRHEKDKTVTGVDLNATTNSNNTSRKKGSQRYTFSSPLSKTEAVVRPPSVTTATTAADSTAPHPLSHAPVFEKVTPTTPTTFLSSKSISSQLFFNYNILSSMSLSPSSPVPAFALSNDKGGSATSRRNSEQQSKQQHYKSYVLVDVTYIKIPINQSQILFESTTATMTTGIATGTTVAVISATTAIVSATTHTTTGMSIPIISLQTNNKIEVMLSPCLHRMKLTSGHVYTTKDVYGTMNSSGDNDDSVNKLDKNTMLGSELPPTVFPSTHCASDSEEDATRPVSVKQNLFPATEETNTISDSHAVSVKQSLIPVTAHTNIDHTHDSNISFGISSYDIPTSTSVQQTSSNEGAAGAVGTSQITTHVNKQRGHSDQLLLSPSAPPLVAEETSKSAVAQETSAEESSDECVICLTDTRNMVLYPCRHLCMCQLCSEALPSQQNKCPICRTVVMLMIQLPIKGSCISSDETIMKQRKIL